MIFQRKSLLKESFSLQEKKQQPYYMNTNNTPKDGGIAKILNDYSTSQHSQSYTNIPTGKQGGIGSSSFVVFRQTNNHIQKGRP